MPSKYVVFNAYEPAWEDISDWANILCDNARRRLPDPWRFAPDFEGTTEPAEGINILIPREDADIWDEAAEELGILTRIIDAIPGHYGDGSWLGVDLTEDDEWIEV